MAKILLTGGTGFLGSFIAHKLLHQGNNVIFITKDQETVSAKNRVVNALCLIDVNFYSNITRYEVYSGDIVKRNLGLSNDNLRSLRKIDIDEVWHIAGSVSFSKNDRMLNYNVNVIGTQNILNCISIIKPKRFYHVSTAFVCGNIESEIFLEKNLDCKQCFNNCYEETKYISEKLVNNWSRNNPATKTSIFRPSIIVGNSQTGFTTSYNGFYKVLRVYGLLKNKFNKHNSSHCGQDIFLPINVPGSKKSTLNIVPIDYVIELMMKIKETDKGGTYHITADTPMTYLYWLNEILKFTGITGVEVDGNYGNSRDKQVINLERFIRSAMSDYFPYVTKEPIFDKSFTKATLGKGYIPSPPVTDRLVEKLILYAVKNDFGIAHAASCWSRQSPQVLN